MANIASTLKKTSIALDGTVIGAQKIINFINGSNVTITVTDDPSNQKVDVEIDSTGGGGGGGITSLNLLTDASQTFAVGTDGTDFGISSSLGVHTFNLPIASATNTGKLSSTDWAMFDSKQDAITTGSTSQFFRGDLSLGTLGANAEFTSTTLNFARDKKVPCICATTANLSVTASGSGAGKTLTATSNGAFTVDGVTPPVGSRILVKDQTTQSDRGIFLLTTAGNAGTPYVLTRATDFDGSNSGQVREGDNVLVTRGTISTGVTYFVSTTGTITIDTTSITFVANSVGDIIISGNSNRLAIWNSTGTLTSDTNAQYSVSNNCLALGAATNASSRLIVNNTATDLTGFFNGALNASSHTQTADNANGMRGFTASLTLAHGAFNNTAGITTPALEPIRAVATVSSGSAPGVVSNIVAVNTLARNQGAGNLTNCVSIAIQTSTNSGGGSIDNVYGLYIANQNQGSFAAGIYSLIASSSNRYGFYFEGNADNVTKGKITHLQTASAANTVVNGLELTNNTTASSGNQMYSGALYWKGSGWKTSAGGASTPCEFRAYILPVQGTTAAECTLTFEASQNSGGFNPVLQLRTNASAPQALFEFGTVASPSISYRVDPDTGTRRSGTNAQAFVCGGADIAGVDVNGLCIGTLGMNNANFGVHPTTTTKHGAVWRSRNAVSVDYFNFQNDSATQEASLFRTSGASGDWKWRMTGGTAALPSYSFYSQTTIGMYAAGTNILGFAVAGAEAFRVSQGLQRTSYDGSNYLEISVSSTGLVNLNSVGSGAAFFFKDNIYMEDGKDFSFSGTVGTKIGQGVNEKIGFWGKTPVVQPLGANQAALTNSTGGTYDGTLADVGAAFDQATLNNNFTDLHTLVNEIRTALVNTGIMKGAA